MRLASALLAATLAALPALAPSARAQTVSTVPLLSVLDVRESGFVDDWQTFTRFKGELYFAADGNDGAGTELWRTDGTAAGTVRLTDLVSGSGHAYPQNMTFHAGHLYFTASADGGGGLFRTDGVNPPARFVPVGGAGAGSLRSTSIGLFGTMNTTATGVEPWFSDGATFGMLANIGPTSQNGRPVANAGLFDFTDRDGTVFFAANDRTSTSGQLWKTQGAGATRVLVLNEGADYASGCTGTVPGPPTEMFSYGGTLYFVATWLEKIAPSGPSVGYCYQSSQDRSYPGALWTSTGSAGQPLATRALASTLGSFGARVQVDRASARWRATSATGPIGGVHLVAGRYTTYDGQFFSYGPPTLYAFNGSSLTPLFTGEHTTRWEDAFSKVGDVGGRRVFSRSRGNASTGHFHDVMTTDGTPAGTVVLATYPGTSAYSSPQAGDAYGSAAYFVAGASLAKQLYRTDGTGIPEVLTALPTGSSYLYMGAALPGGAVVYTDNGIGEGTVYFVGTPGVRVRRQPLTGTGTAAQTLSDGTGTLGVAFDVQAITGSGEMRLELRDHTVEPLADGAPTAGVLRRYVRIERPASIAAIDTDLTFTYTDDDLAESGVASEAALAVWKFSDGVWTKLPVASRDLAANTITVAGITSFSDFVLADGAAVLPVELVSFTGATDGTTARLAWTTASETNNAGFVVEHRQGAGAWVERGVVAGQGTTTERIEYAFTVRDLPAGTHRFRLRQRDLDGATHVSPEVEVVIGSGERLAVTVLGARAVRIDAAGDRPLDVELYDLLGRQLLRQRVDVVGSAEVPLPTLATGVYVVRVTDGRVAETRRVLVH